MNTIVDVRANIYASDIDAEKMKVTPLMELVIVYSNGKAYTDNEQEIDSEDVYADLRLMLNPKQLRSLIVALEGWEKTIKNREEVWDAIFEKTQVSKPQADEPKM